MKVTMFSARSYDRSSFGAVRNDYHEFDFTEARLDPDTAGRAAGSEAVCIFVNDRADAATLAALAAAGVGTVALRCAGFNNVDIAAAARLGIDVVRVPAYSPDAVAEHTIGLLLTLNRHLHKAYHRVRDGNFSLDGLVGNDLAGRTAGVVGTGRIGAIVARLLRQFRCEVRCVDPFPDPQLLADGFRYVELEELWPEADVVSLNCPLTPATHHLVSATAVAQMKPGMTLINTGRGALVDTAAAIDGLKSGRIGALGIDVYEEEADLFFEDRSNEVIADDTFARLLTFPNVVITAHQAFLSHDALDAIARTTLANLDDLEAGRPCPNLVSLR